MSVSSELRLNGHVDFDVLFEMVKLLFDKRAKKNFKVNNLGPIDTLDYVKEIYGESKDYEMEFGWIYFNYEGEKRILSYQYSNINTYERLRYYEKRGAADMVKTETSVLTLGYWGHSVNIMETIARYFGGWLMERDDSDDPPRRIEPVTEFYAHLGHFDRAQSMPNLFSKWWPAVKDCGIKVPKSTVFPVPSELIKHFYMEKPDEDIAAVQAWVDGTVSPGLKEAGLQGLLFVKNGDFSNKFDADRSCMVRQDELTDAIININYAAMCCGADMGGGCNELVVRERILHDARVTPCIYSGLPLRSEFRVFYDFDLKKVLFTANYWEYDYIYEHLYDVTDRIIFDHERERLENTFREKKEAAEALVAEHMVNVEGLSGPWSVDLMMTEDGEMYLIDMAVAEQSAYWEFRPGNERKLAESRVESMRQRQRYLDTQMAVVQEI